jgi:hypothetical protein
MTAICVAIFIMFMGIRPAPAIELPKEILGAWCGQWSYQFPNDDTTMHWWSVDNVENCGNPGGVHVHKNGYAYNRFGPQGSCKFTSIKFKRHGNPTDHLAAVGPNGEIEEQSEAQAPPSDVYLIRATCKHKTKSWHESYEIRISNDWLWRDPVLEIDFRKGK